MGPGPAHRAGRDPRRRPHRRGRHGLRERRPPARRELLERHLVGVDPLRTEVVREIVRDGRLPRRPAVDGRGGGLGRRRPRARDAALEAPRRALRPPRRLRVERRARRARTSARAAASSCASRGVRAVKLRFHHADWRDDVAVVERVREAVGREMEIMVDANQGWRMPGDREPRWDVGDGRAVRARARAARRLLARGAAAHRRPRRLRGAAATHVAAARRGRDGALGAGGARPGAARRDRRRPDRRGARARDRRLPADRRARRPRRARVVAAHVVERLRPRRQPPPRARGLDGARSWRCRSTRPSGRPSGATGCSPRRSRSPPTARSRRRPGPGSGSRPTSTRSSAGGSAETPTQRGGAE